MPGPAGWPRHSRRSDPTSWIADDVDSNIVVLDLTQGPDARTLAGVALDQGVAVSVLGARTARLVTHMDVDDDGIERAVDVLTALLSG